MTECMRVSPMERSRSRRFEWSGPSEFQGSPGVQSLRPAASKLASEPDQDANSQSPIFGESIARRTAGLEQQGGVQKETLPVPPDAGSWTGTPPPAPASARETLNPSDIRDSSRGLSGRGRADSQRALQHRAPRATR